MSPLTYKNYLIRFSAFFVVLVLSSGVARAFDYPNPLIVNNIPDFLALILDGLSLLLLPLIVMYIIYAGYLFVTAQGEEGKLQKARHALLWTLVGAAVILGAQIMANILKDTLKNLNP